MVFEELIWHIMNSSHSQCFFNVFVEFFYTDCVLEHFPSLVNLSLKKKRKSISFGNIIILDAFVDFRIRNEGVDLALME